MATATSSHAAQVWFFASLGTMGAGKGPIRVQGATVREIIDNLERAYPGMRDVLIYQGDIMPGLAVVVDGETSNMGMLTRVEEGSEVHFLPAIGGGAG